MKTKTKIPSYDELISKENLIDAFFRFRAGKKSKTDILEFSLKLPKEIDKLHFDLKNKTYKHGAYKHFIVNDPKRRDIHKASVRDRVVHHLIYSALYPYFDNLFIYDSYSCRLHKGTYKAISRMKEFTRKASKDYQRPIYVLKCDIRKFFANIDQKRLMDILKKHINDEGILWLLGNIVESFHTPGLENKGLPLGNLTSQLLVNIYMNEFDHFVKRDMREKYYIRFADDFIVVSDSESDLVKNVSQMSVFLYRQLGLSIHPDKVFIKNISEGVDFLGWVHFPTYRILRTTTKRRMLKRLSGVDLKDEVKQSYLGLLRHGNTYKIQKTLE